MPEPRCGDSSSRASSSSQADACLNSRTLGVSCAGLHVGSMRRNPYRVPTLSLGPPSLMLLERNEAVASSQRAINAQGRAQERTHGQDTCK